MAKSPNQIIQEKFETKDKLINDLAPKLVKMADEKESDLKERLASVSAKKLLKLWGAEERLEKIGGRQTVLGQIKEAYTQLDKNTSADFLTKFESFSAGKLIEALKVAQKKAKQKGANQKGANQKGANQKGANQKGANQKGANQKGANQKEAK